MKKFLLPILLILAFINNSFMKCSDSAKVITVTSVPYVVPIVSVPTEPAKVIELNTNPGANINFAYSFNNFDTPSIKEYFKDNWKAIFAILLAAKYYQSYCYLKSKSLMVNFLFNETSKSWTIWRNDKWIQYKDYYLNDIDETLLAWRDHEWNCYKDLVNEINDRYPSKSIDESLNQFFTDINKEIKILSRFSFLIGDRFIGYLFGNEKIKAAIKKLNCLKNEIKINYYYKKK